MVYLSMNEKPQLTLSNFKFYLNFAIFIFLNPNKLDFRLQTSK